MSHLIGHLMRTKEHFLGIDKEGFQGSCLVWGYETGENVDKTQASGRSSERDKDLFRGDKNRSNVLRKMTG